MIDPPAPPISARRESAFSLVEILVVLLMIAILAAIAFLSVGRARDRSEGGLAGTTARALSEGIDQFQRDHGGRVPDEPGTSDWGGGWSSPVDVGNQGRPYVRNGAVEPLVDGSISLETTSGGTDPGATASKRTRIRYVADQPQGLYALVVLAQDGSSLTPTCHVSNTDGSTSTGRAFLAGTGADRSC